MRMTVQCGSRGWHRPLAVGSACLGIALLASACRPNYLNLLSGVLAFSSPDDPAALTKPDAGVVEIAFGPVVVGATKTLTLATVSLSGSVTLGALTPVQPDSEFSLPFMAGTEVGSSPSQIMVAFSPTSIGNKTAVYSLAYTAPAGGAVTIELIGDGVPSGLSVSPNPVNFGNVELNQTQPVSLTIANNTETSASLTLSSLQGPDPTEFSLGAPSSTTLAPGASATLNAVFAPLATGAASGSFTITGAVIAGTPSSPTTVNLTGTGVQSWLQVTSPLDFGYVPPGETLVKSATVRNAGSFSTLHLVAPAPRITSGGMVFALSSPQPVLPLAIAPGQTAQIPVSFAPPILGSYPGTLSLATDDPGSPAPVIPLEGNGGGPQILCISPVNFGPVPLGHSGSQQTLCTNAGTDIPKDPDGGLRIAQASLTTDNPAFVASLTLPDGGLADPDAGVLLAAGQSTAIQVTFRPEDAGIYRSRLVIPSSDLADTDAGVLLLGEGVVPGLCSVDLLPRQLSFGEVPSGDTGTLQFEISNVSQNLCVLTGISLDPQSDPAFSLPGGNPGYQLLSFPGDSDNPAALPSSLTVDVQFAPSTAESAATGNVDVAISNAAPPDQTVALTATSQAGCLTIEPPSYDFGLVGFSPSNQQICVPDSKGFLARNACAIPVTLTQLDVSSGAAPAPQFSLVGSPQLSLTIPPGGEVGFQVSFVPTDVGPKLGAINVGTSEFPNAPFLVTLEGNPETAGQRTDTFIVPTPTKQLDMLWILDEDDDFTQVNTIAGFLPQLISALDDAGIDYRMAVTSTDTCDAGSSDRGFLEPCDHCLSTASNSPTLVTPATPGAATALVDLFNLFDIPPQLGFCEKLNGDEHFFDSIADAFSPELLAGHNSGFLRPGAYLAIVVVNGDSEDDGAGNGVDAGNPYVTSLEQVTTLVESLKADPSMVSFSYINYNGGSSGGKVGQLVQATGGVEIDTVALQAVWEASLLNLVASTEGPGIFHLTARPAASDRIQVYLDNVLTRAWSYDALTNEIVFFASQSPAPGSTIKVTYNLGCP